MPVFFERGDILGFDVDAIVVPHAPSDRMPWCDYDDFDLWDVTLDVFSRSTDMENMMKKYVLFHGNGYNINDYIDENDIKDGRMIFRPEKYPEITVSQCCGLPVKYVFHVCVRPYLSYLINSDDYSLCAKMEKYMLSRCYWMALNCAAGKDVKKIAFPLFSTDCPKEIAYETAHSVPQKWLDENKEREISKNPPHGSALNRLMAIMNRQAAEMEIYIVEPQGIDIDRMKAWSKDPSAHRPFVSEYELRLEREMAAFDGDADAFRASFIKICFDNYIKQNRYLSRLVKLISYSLAYKFRDDPSMHPHKHRVIAVAVGMGLSDYERFAFIRCAGYEEYPEDERDFLVEKLISEGKRDFHELNDALIDKDPSYALDAEVKGAGNSKKKKRKS